MFQKPIYRLRRKAAACAVCAVTLLTPALAAGFTDVPQNAWYASAVNEVVEAGLLSGTSAATFQPNGKVTRAMTVTALWRLAGAPMRWPGRLKPEWPPATGRGHSSPAIW